MVVRRERRIRKLRGRKSGFGSHKKHKGGGSRGGRGISGLHKSKVMRMIKYFPDHYGKHGMSSVKVTKIRTVNLKDLDSNIEQFLKEKKVVKEQDGIKIKLSDLGYDKLLGSGKVNHPLIIEAKYFSKNAIKKLEEAKGKAIVVS